MIIATRTTITTYLESIEEDIELLVDHDPADNISIRWPNLGDEAWLPEEEVKTLVTALNESLLIRKNLRKT